jgi:erythromycin esterase-like protein
VATPSLTFSAVVDPDTQALVGALEQSVIPVGPAAEELLFAEIGEARVVLLGEATHGTDEFYRERARLTLRLIRERGFGAIAVEADWPDAYRVNRWIRGLGMDRSAAEALGDFRRFPSWMWRNTVVQELAQELRTLNSTRSPEERVGFYGLDLYSLHASVESVLRYLDATDAAAARRARERYACFDHLHHEPQAYAEATAWGFKPGCEDEVVAQLRELQASRSGLLRREGIAAEDAHFEAEQNARVVADAERYYRQMFGSSVESWNLRDTHMGDTLDALLAREPRTKIVVWAHNSHLGDARATEVAADGELNVGQLARERHPGQVYSLGFTTHEGTVTAASRWDGPAEQMRVRPALEGSCEALFHRLPAKAFLLPLRDPGEAVGQLQEPRLERAIGVVYQPATERRSHYFHVRLPAQFDAVMHLDRTRALEPLERSSTATDEPPETFPSTL